MTFEPRSIWSGAPSNGPMQLYGVDAYIYGGEKKISVEKVKRNEHTDLLGSAYYLHLRGVWRGKIHYNMFILQSLINFHPHYTMEIWNLFARGSPLSRLPDCKVEKSPFQEEVKSPLLSDPSFHVPPLPLRV